MIDLRRCPKTARLLEERGVVLVGGKPKLAEAWLVACEPHLRGAKKEHKERQEAVREHGVQPDAIAFLGWVLLTDSWRHIRAEAVQALARQPTEQSQGLIALALADRSQLVVRAGHKALHGSGTLVPFLVIFALWEDKAGGIPLLQYALGMARRNPQPAMRQVLPRLEQEARRFFILPVRRRALREIISELDQVTAHLKDLPLTAMARVESVSLPLPASDSGELVEQKPVRSGLLQRLLQHFRS